MLSRRGPSLVTATSRAGYSRLCRAAPELDLACTASRAPRRGAAPGGQPGARVLWRRRGKSPGRANCAGRG